MAIPNLLTVGQKVTAALLNSIIGQLAPADSGIQSVNVPTVNTPGSATVTFGASKFTAAPVPSVSIQGAHPEYYAVSYSAVTTTGMTVTVTRLNASGGNPVNVGWSALQTQ